jgi:hypothetical protein
MVASKGDKGLCFDTLLQVFILKGLAAKVIISNKKSQRAFSRAKTRVYPLTNLHQRYLSVQCQIQVCSNPATHVSLGKDATSGARGVGIGMNS